MAPKTSAKVPIPQLMYTHFSNILCCECQKTKSRETFAFVHEFNKKIDILQVFNSLEKAGYTGKIVNKTLLAMKKEGFRFTLRDDSKLIMNCTFGDRANQEFIVKQHFNKMYFLLK